MTYLNRFQPTDELIRHLDQNLGNPPNPYIETRFAGFLSVSIVTVYELAIKDVFIAFAAKKHQTFGSFAGKFFEQINGKIKLDSIKKDYLQKFGQKYVDRFEKKLNKTEKIEQLSHGVSIKSSYGNIITWRHTYVHQDRIIPTYREVKSAYEHGKKVIDCLSNSLVR